MRTLQLFLLGTMLSTVLISCQKDELSDADDLNSLEETTAFDAEKFAGIKMCTEMYPEGVTPRAAAISSNVWSNGSTLKVKFIGGTSYVRQKVMQYANEWSDYANITFDFVTDGAADIRISFKEGGSYSYIGSYATQVPSDEETMNFGWFNNNTSDTEFSRTTIHEFGHALGLIHEHQHPEVTIPWDKPKVYEYYGGPPNNWSKEQVDHNLFATYSASQTQYSAYDPQSIMHYAIDNALTIGDFEVGWNTVLSATDKAFIADLYPN